MVNIACLGTSEFVMGFRLAGIRKVFEVEGNSEKTLKQALEDKEIGILIMDQKIIDELSQDTKEDLFDRIQPTTVAVSTQDDQGDLRRMIKRSVGVDVWGE